MPNFGDVVSVLKGEYEDKIGTIISTSTEEGKDWAVKLHETDEVKHFEDDDLQVQDSP